MKKVIIYLHGFNSASLDLNGDLLISKDKLKVLQSYCTANKILLYSPNVDYRKFQGLVDTVIEARNQYLNQGFKAILMGSSMGGFACEYLAMKTADPAVMINPAIAPSELLPQFIGVTANNETGEPYDWNRSYCLQYLPYESELAAYRGPIRRTILLDLGDELIDAEKTRLKYAAIADVFCFAGGSHSFEHMQEALPEIDKVVFS